MFHPFLIVLLTSIATILVINILGWRAINKRQVDAALHASEWRTERSAD